MSAVIVPRLYSRRLDTAELFPEVKVANRVFGVVKVPGIVLCRDRNDPSFLSRHFSLWDYVLYSIFLSFRHGEQNVRTQVLLQIVCRYVRSASSF